MQTTLQMQDRARQGLGMSKKVELSLEAPPGLSLEAPPGLDQVSNTNEYRIGEKVLALRSDGSWSPCTIAEISKDRLKVHLNAGMKQIRRDMAHKLLKKMESTTRLCSFKEEDEEEAEEMGEEKMEASECQSWKTWSQASQTAMLEAENACLSHEKTLTDPAQITSPTIQTPVIEAENARLSHEKTPTGRGQILKPEDWIRAGQMAVREAESTCLSQGTMLTAPAPMTKQSQNWSKAAQIAMLEAESARFSHEQNLMHMQSQMYNLWAESMASAAQGCDGYMSNPWAVPQAIYPWHEDGTKGQGWNGSGTSGEKIGKPNDFPSWGSASTASGGSANSFRSDTDEDTTVLGVGAC